MSSSRYLAGTTAWITCSFKALRMSSSVMSSLCCTEMTMVWTRTGMTAPWSCVYCTVTCLSAGQGDTVRPKPEPMACHSWAQVPSREAGLPGANRDSPHEEGPSENEAHTFVSLEKLWDDLGIRYSYSICGHNLCWLET